MDRNEIGRRFKALRIRKGFGKQRDMIEDFKNKTGIVLQKSALSQYESGKRLPEHELLSRFVDYFGVTTDYLYGRSESQLSVFKSTAKRLEEVFDGLSADDQIEAEKFMMLLHIMKRGGKSCPNNRNLKSEKTEDTEDR